MTKWQWYCTSTVTLNTNCSTLHHKDWSKSILHSPTVSLIQITRQDRNTEHLLNVKNSTKRHKRNSGSEVITLSANGSWISFSATPETCFILNSKTSHPICTMKRSETWFTTRNSLLQNFKENYLVERSLPGIPVVNQTHLNQPSHLIFLIQTFALSSNQYGAAYSVQWLGYMVEDLGFKSWQQQGNYIFTKTSRSPPAPTQPPTQWKPQLFPWQQSDQGRQSDHSQPPRAEFTNQWSYTSTQPVRLHSTQWHNFSLPLPPTYVHLSQKVTSFLALQRNLFIQYLPLTCTLHDQLTSF